jgi:hypothetical protein
VGLFLNKSHLIAKSDHENGCVNKLLYDKEKKFCDLLVSISNDFHIGLKSVEKAINYYKSVLKFAKYCSVAATVTTRASMLLQSMTGK